MNNPFGGKPRSRRRRGGEGKSKPTSENLSALEKDLKLKFKNKKLLEEALTHPSFLHDGQGKVHNERLEFLGDSFLGLVVSHLLFVKNQNADEGELTRVKSQLVSLKFISQLAGDLKIEKFLRVGEAEKGPNFPTQSMLADAFEALLGAILLDQGYEKGSKFIERLYLPHLEISQQKGEENYKGALQEILQRKYKEHPHYELVSEHGPDHAKIFEVKVLFRGKIFGIGKGKSKKDAEKEAAREAMAVLGKE